MPAHRSTGRRALRAVRGRTRQVLATGDRGDVIGWAIMAPLIMMLTVGSVQVAMWYQARTICQGAAQAGVRAGKVLQAAPGTGSARAAQFLSHDGAGSVVGPRAAEKITATTITVSCSADALRVIPLPGLSIAVRQSASAQRERFTTPGAP